MKFKFDANQQYQLDAISSITDLFKGQLQDTSSCEINMPSRMELLGHSLIQNQLGLGNRLTVADESIDQNLQKIQKLNNIHQHTSVKKEGLNFAVEMETGTGKTYVYLRTIFELNKIYGFKKFIIVVPSVAIREGVLKSIDMTREHFQGLYNNLPFDYFIYDSKRVAQLRGFARNNELQIMIINIQAFDKKDIAIIHQNRDQMDGYRPIEFIQATNPIVIMDEPQNMETPTAREAIASLNPLCTLRYSATHREKYNLVYQLDPVKAFQMKLVKKITVNAIIADNDPTQSYIRVEEIINQNNTFKVKLSYYEQGNDGVKLKSRQFKLHDNLFLVSNEYEAYRNGFIIDEINARPGMEYVKFTNGIRLCKGEEQGGNKDDVIKKQIHETIRAHFEKEYQVRNMGLKVLSLFFLDRVENYRVYKDDNTYELGKYGKWFEQIYEELAEEYHTLFKQELYSVETIHNGYFAKDNKGRFKNSSSGTSQEDADTYSLIMKDKEKLLSLDNPLKFIFSHSALREGWDNPNVFQICTINETASQIKKRQEIGRGLRLPVNQDGDRVFDEYVNNLVVVANESYDQFVSSLQKEFEEDCGVIFGRLPVEAFIGIPFEQDGVEKEINTKESEIIWDHLKKIGCLAADGFILPAFNEMVEKNTFNVPDDFLEITPEIIRAVEGHQIERHIERNDKVKAKINEDTLLDPEFKKFWDKINTKTIYSVHYTTEELIEKASIALSKMPGIEPPKLRSYMVDIKVEDKGISSTMVRTPQTEYGSKSNHIPDVLTYIQSKVELTRSTIFSILKRSKRLGELPLNPQQFMDSVVKEIRQVLHRMIVDGIKYEKLDEISYEVSELRKDEEKLMFQRDRIVPTTKSVYDYITYDSSIEKKFAEDLESLWDVKYFIKLPTWFKVPTPVGSYNPDWAILKQNGEIVYMIRETKATKEQLKLRIPESDKIECGRQHFIAIGVDYDVATCVEDARL